MTKSLTFTVEVKLRKGSFVVDLNTITNALHDALNEVITDATKEKSSWDSSVKLK